MGRKEQKEERRQQILFKALELFVTKGYQETKISDIAGELGISVGLLFHYYESKEALHYELVKMGVEGTKYPNGTGFEKAIDYFAGFLKVLLETVKTNPWVSQIFILTSQARRPGMPEEARKLAMTIDQIGFSAKVVEKGQKDGSIREGEPVALSAAFWCSVQGIVEQHAYDGTLPLPEADWVTDILRRR